LSGRSFFLRRLIQHRTGDVKGYGDFVTTMKGGDYEN